MGSGTGPDVRQGPDVTDDFDAVRGILLALWLGSAAWIFIVLVALFGLSPLFGGQ